MRIAIAKIGRVAYPEITGLAGVYLERLGGFLKVESVELKDTAALLRRFPPSADHPWVLLDERGKEWTSKELAAQLKGWSDDPAVKSLTFVIGGPMGVDAETKRSAKTAWALSRGTLTSDLSWLICLEQLYRAYSILKNTGYHHE